MWEEGEGGAMAMMMAGMHAEEEDVRSIEAENVGDDDELDADLEREFLLQQEAKSRFRGSSSLAADGEEEEEEEDEDEEGGGVRPGTRGDGYEDVDGDGDNAVDQLGAQAGQNGWECEENRANSRREEEFRVLVSGSSAALWKELEDCDELVGMQNSCEVQQQRRQQQGLSLGGSRLIAGPPEAEILKGGAIRRRAAGTNVGMNKKNKFVLFPEIEPVQLPDGGTVEMGQKKSGTAVDTINPNGAALRYEEVAELYDTVFQVPFSKVKEETSKWLRLGLPSNSDKYSHSGANSYQRRKIVSGSSSKVSVRTATSLERQYSTGSTSTVDSPHFVAQEWKGDDRPRSTRKPHASPGGSRLTFSFPGWGVDISKGEKHPSVVSHHHAETTPEPSGQPPKRLRESPDPFASTGVRGKAVEENLGDRSPVWELPDEILLQVMRRLGIRDLCSSVQTCKRWYAVGLQNDLWEHFLGDVDNGLLSDSSSDVLPRWVCKKSLCLSENVRVRFNVFSKGYDYLRRALHEWWDNGLLSSRYPSKGMYSLIRKLTVNDWSLLYEALGVVFTDRADRIASMLLRKLKPVGCLTGETSLEPVAAEKRDCNVGIGSLAALYENPKNIFSLAGSSSEFEVHWKSGSVKEVSQVEGVVGKEFWESLLKSWKRYKGWLHLISTHCPDLNHEVMLERARSLNWTATPTLYDKGLICFRSQVVLRYGLRNILQAGFLFLTTQDARDYTTEQDMDLLRSSHHLLQELDVADDFTLPQKSHTQTKLRQCFRSALLTSSKLALHMNDKLNHL